MVTTAPAFIYITVIFIDGNKIKLFINIQTQILKTHPQSDGLLIHSSVDQSSKFTSSGQVGSVVYIVIGPVFTVILVTRGSTN